MCDAKSATITFILFHLQKKERDKSELSVKPPSILTTFAAAAAEKIVGVQ